MDAVVTGIGGAVVTGSVIELRAEGSWAAGRPASGRRRPSRPAPAARSRGEGPVRCGFSFTEGGRYRVSASIVDDAGRANGSELTVWVPVARGLRPTAASSRKPSSSCRRPRTTGPATWRAS